MTQNQDIAFLGTGLMGAPMARRLCAAGFKVRVWNRSAEKAAALAEVGAVPCATIQSAVAGATAIITMLAGQSAIEAVLFAEDGVMLSAEPGACVIDMSSLAPDLARAHHENMVHAGFRMLDAPVSGGVAGAEAGTLSIMVGGLESEFDSNRGLFEPMGTPFYLGAAGAGQVCKMVNQAIVHIYIGAVTEGLLLAEAMGVSAKSVRQAIAGGFCQSRILDMHGARMVDRNFVPGGPLKFSIKDLRVANKLSEQAGLSIPLAKEVLGRYEALLADGLGDLDHSALLLAYEADNRPHRVSPNQKDERP